ncbi:MAG: D-aminoacyl-tRNA deacylase [Candidatus Bruticola sp.]
MRAVVQRVVNSKVEVDKQIVGQIGHGLLVLVAVHCEDTEAEADWLARKIANLRIFSDENDKMNLSVSDIGGQILVVSQFTLYGDCRRGSRPSYSHSASPQEASRLYSYFVKQIKAFGLEVQEGIFQAHMQVSLVNEGPVTVIIDTPSKTQRG